MNILKREIWADKKYFIFWSIGIFLLVFAGMTKFMGFTGGTDTQDLAALMENIPRPFMAVFGMVNIDLESLSGFYYVIVYYVMICTAIYSIHLGSNALLKEEFDKTYEFIFTKPRTRSFILFMKLGGAYFYLLFFSVVHFGITHLTFAVLGIRNDIGGEIFLSSVAVFLVGILFLSLSACVGAFVKRSENGPRISYGAFFVFFVLAVLYDVIEKGRIIRWFSPLKYFDGKDLTQGYLDSRFILLTILLALIFSSVTMIFFQKKDLNAV